MSTVLDNPPVIRKAAASDTEPHALTDGFHLLIDALKLNGIDTIFGLPGIPITDLTRLAQAEGMRVISLPPRAERRQRRRGRRLPHPEAGHLPHGLRAGLPQRPHGAGQRDRQLLPDDPDQRLQRARDRRPAAGRLRGDGPAQRRQALLQGRVSRAPRAGHRHRHRAGDPLGALGPPRRRLPRPAGQAVLADDGGRGRQAIAGEGGRPRAAPIARARHGATRARRAQGRQAAADPARQGCGLRASGQRDPRTH